MKKHFLLLAGCCLLLSGIYAQPDSIYAQPENSGTIFLSRDQGESWRQSDAGIPAEASINAMILVSNTVVVATEEHGIYMSEDGLKTWHPSNKGLPVKARIKSLVSYQNLLLAGSYYNGVYISYDNGYSWEQSNKGLENLNIRCFYAQGSMVFAGTDLGIYFSTNQGKTWSLTTQGIQMTTQGIQINAFTSLQGILFAATNQGALRSEDSGQTWSWIWKQGTLTNMIADGQNVISLISDYRVLVAADRGRKWWVNFERNFAHQTFKITPSSSPVLIAPWKSTFKSFRENATFRSDGLPERSSFTQILVTPYGILVAVSYGFC